MLRPVVLVGCLLVASLPAHASTGDAGARALAYLSSLPDADLTAIAPYAAEAAAAASLDVRTWPTPERSAYDALVRAASTADDVASVRLVHAVGVAGYDPRDLNGRDLLARLRADHQDGGFVASDRTFSPVMDGFALLSMRAAGVPADDPLVTSTLAKLGGFRDADGGWGTSYSPTARSGTDETAMVLAGLSAYGVNVAGDTRASLFLNSTHARGGGHAPQITLGGGANVQSTVWALHGYRLLRIDPPSDDIVWLLSQQRTDGSFGGDAFATSEAALYLAGGHYPLPGFVPVDLGVLHALDPLRLDLPADYTSAEWSIPGVGTFSGTRVSIQFPHAGPYTLSLNATGPHAIRRGPIDITVLSARPRIVLGAPELNALRFAPVDLDVSGSFDPDGRIASWRVDWGDGAVDAQLSHAYAEPGDRDATIVATDDSGVESAPAHALVHVVDRAPTIGGLPAQVDADRVTTVHLAADASDPDGDSTRVAWSTDEGARGSGPVADVRFATLGVHDVHFAAADPYGLTATADVRVDVADLPPALANLTLPAGARENETLRFAVDASDADGPAPNVTWQIGNGALYGVAVETSLPPGDFVVNVTARDIDGATASVGARLHVSASRADANAPTPPSPNPPTPSPRSSPSPDEPPTPPPQEPPSSSPATPPLDAPTLRAPEAPVLAGVPARVTVDLPSGAVGSTISFGDGGTANGTDATHAWALPGDYELRAVARAADGRASFASLVLHVAASPRPSRAAEPLSPASLNATTPTPRENAPSPSEVAQMVATRRDAPALWALGPALLAALVAPRGRAARRARRSRR